MLAETINAIEEQAISYALTVAYNSDNLAEFIDVMNERLNQLKEEQ